MKIWLAVLTSLIFATPATAQTQVSGRINKLWVESNADLSVDFSAAGPCGSGVFRMSHNAANFDQMMALLLTGAASGRTIVLETTASCSGTINNISHGASIF